MLSGAIKRVSAKYFPLQQTSLLHKAIYCITLILFIVAALQQLGFKLSVLLGSAGILTAAIAFASQTSISNIISGAFLIMEKSYKIGDKIKIGSTIGTINSVDLLSVKILTAQNTLIRIPNETLIKSEITNLSKYPTRRLELPLKVSIYEDIDTVKEILLSILKKHPTVVQESPPSVSVQKIDSTGIYLQASLLANQSDYDSLTNSLYSEILTAFKAQHIQI
jgi:small-conductance mechanosensitive channel